MADLFLTSPLEHAWVRLGANIMQVGEGWRVPEFFAGVTPEVQAARQALALADDTPRGTLRVQGETAAECTRQALGTAPDAVGAIVTDSAGVEIASLRPDLYHIGTATAARAEVQERLKVSAQAQQENVTVTDITHGRFELRLVGPAAAELMSKVCALDFDDSVFPSGTAAETSVARTRQLILRVDVGPLPAYRLLGGRALGVYVWDTLMEAGRELGIRPMGARALETLAG